LEKLPRTKINTIFLESAWLGCALNKALGLIPTTVKMGGGEKKAKN
jgi:hypothetical protein